MLIHPKQPDPAPVPTYLLTPASGFIDPCLFNDFTNGRNVRAVRLGWSTYHPAVVGDGRRVVVETDRASDTFRIDGDLPPGTPVLVWLGRNFRCAVEADLRAEHEREQAAADARRAEAEERWRHRRENEKQEALRFNATIRLPVKWDVGIKAVRSGLSASSSGDGCKANTVFHIHLPEGLQAGRLHRVENDYLCSSQSSGTGFFAGELARASSGKDAYVPKITCKACLDLAARLQNRPGASYGPPAVQPAAAGPFRKSPPLIKRKA
jgi:hypothetical protein